MDEKKAFRKERREVHVNKYEWGGLYTSASENKVYLYYKSLKIIGREEEVEIEAGSHILIQNNDLGSAALILNYCD